jgi:hypothetical protein
LDLNPNYVVTELHLRAYCAPNQAPKQARLSLFRTLGQFCRNYVSHHFRTGTRGHPANPDTPSETPPKTGVPGAGLCGFYLKDESV